MTSLPIDYRSRPWRTKYLDEETPVINQWFIFGTYPDGSVGISDGQEDIVEWIPRKLAEEIIEARNAFSVKFVEVINRGTKFDDSLNPSGPDWNKWPVDLKIDYRK